MAARGAVDGAEGTQSTGIAGLDRVVRGLALGDNVVWQVDAIDEFAAMAQPFVACGVAEGRCVIYFRFARHAPVLPDGPGVEVVQLEPQAGFETFLDAIHRTAEQAGHGAYYVFDSLSDLTADWYCDQMVGNFFELTCPYLYRLETIAYFALLKGVHSQYAINPITDTTQVLFEVYRREGELYVHPTKVTGRSSPRMYSLHRIDGDQAVPVTRSELVSEIMMSSPRSALGLSQYQLGVWTRTFVQAETILEERRLGRATADSERDIFQRILRMAISRDERVLALAERYFELADMVAIGKRLLGTGLIGGKSVGMLLARAILCKSDPRWNRLLEAHDSFYIPSDVFYTFLVRNGCWALRKRHLKGPDFLDGIEDVQTRIREGEFPPHIQKRFVDMLEYFGQAPIIVRSSSLLEDNFGNSFAGKYDSVFCPNQGSPQDRLHQFLAAVKHVYASTVSAPALNYRARHNLLDRDEQMALLVQRVSGAQYGPYYFPQVAGAGFSFNPYVWEPGIDQEAGVLRLVFGLGTRAVDRSDDDYTRLVALNAPERRPEAQTEAEARYSQRRVDVLDLDRNAFVTKTYEELAPHLTEAPMRLFSSVDSQRARQMRQQGRLTPPPRILRFEGLIRNTTFIDDMRAMMKALANAYAYPVDVEFTANFRDSGRYSINIVQCRPFQVKAEVVDVDAPSDIPSDAIVLKTKGPVIGRSRTEQVERIIAVMPAPYGALPVQERYAVARLLGNIMRAEEPAKPETVFMLGPGRWGTTTPSLGVPVSFAEINRVTMLCEIVAMRDDLVPDLSFGTHFFSELVEMDILYLALRPGQQDVVLNTALLDTLPNRLDELVPGSEAHASILKVIDSRDLPGGASFILSADTLKQRAICYIG